MDKSALVEQLIGEYKKQLNTAQQARQNAQGEANEHEGRMASRYDTFKEEAQYLAAGYERRCADLNETIRRLKEFKRVCPGLSGKVDKIGPGAIVQVINAREEHIHYFIVSCGGGIQIDTEHHPLLVIDSRTPMARALFGKKEKDEASYAIGDKKHCIRIESVF